VQPICLEAQGNSAA
jgi:hypothetical protein